MTDRALDHFTLTCAWTWALSLVAKDAERAIKWECATLRALGDQPDEYALLAALDEKSAP